MEKIRQRQQEERSRPLGKLIKSPSEQNYFLVKQFYIISLPLGGPFSFNSTLQYFGSVDISSCGHSQSTCEE